MGVITNPDGTLRWKQDGRVADRRKPAWMDDLVQAAADAYRVLPAMVLSDIRDAPVVKARSAVIYVLRDAGLSLPHIGHLVNRDHSTVLTALRRVEADPGQHIVATALALAHLPEEGVA